MSFSREKRETREKDCSVQNGLHLSDLSLQRFHFGLAAIEPFRPLHHYVETLFGRKREGITIRSFHYPQENCYQWRRWCNL